MRHVLVTGAGGQLGTELQRCVWPAGWQVTALDVADLDLRDTAAIADMVAAVPGAYAWLGATPGPGLHNASFDFDDSLIPLGAAYLARMVERRTAA